MSADASDNTIAHRLVALIDSGRLSPDDVEIGHQCVRRLTQPLRLIVLGSDVGHAVGLLNLMSGYPIGAPRGDRVRIQCVQATKAFATADYGDGGSRTFARESFGDLFAEAPVRVKLGLDTPALKRLSLMVAAEADTEKMCQAMEQTLMASDVAIFAGSEASPPMISLWSRMPERLKDHSYLALAPGMPSESWRSIHDGFTDVLTIDTKAALAAKSQHGGVDKEAFRAAGGAALVKAIKRELEVLAQSAMDATDVLLSRYGSEGPVEDVADSQQVRLPEPVRETPKVQARDDVVPERASERKAVVTEGEKRAERPALPVVRMRDEAAPQRRDERKPVVTQGDQRAERPAQPTLRMRDDVVPERRDDRKPAVTQGERAERPAQPVVRMRDDAAPERRAVVTEDKRAERPAMREPFSRDRRPPMPDPSRAAEVSRPNDGQQAPQPVTPKKVRPKDESDRKRPGATPWSLDL